MNANDYFFDMLLIDDIYHTESICFEPFYNFKYKIESLNRYWKYQKKFINEHEKILNKVQPDSAEFYDIYDDIAGSDIEFIPDFIKASTLSLCFSIFEILLTDLSEEISKDLEIEIQLDQGKMPFINKCISWMIEICGLDIQLDYSTKKNLDTIRKIRNIYIHKMNKDIPDYIKRTIEDMVNDHISEEEVITDEFIDQSLEQICDLVKEIELAYIDFFEKLPKSE